MEHWANALHQPEAAAKAMLGQNVSYDRVLAGMNVNVWDVNDVIQALVRSRQPVQAGKLADPHLPLGALLDG